MSFAISRNLKVLLCFSQGNKQNSKADKGMVMLRLVITLYRRSIDSHEMSLDKQLDDRNFTQQSPDYTRL